MTEHVWSYKATAGRLAVMLPASTVVSIDPEERKIFVDLTTGQIEQAPEFRRDKHLGDGGYRELLVTHYGLGPPFGAPSA